MYVFKTKLKTNTFSWYLLIKEESQIILNINRNYQTVIEQDRNK